MQLEGRHGRRGRQWWASSEYGLVYLRFPPPVQKQHPQRRTINGLSSGIHNEMYHDEAKWQSKVEDVGEAIVTQSAT